MVRTWWQKLFSQGQSRAHRGFHRARVQQRLIHKPLLEPLEHRSLLSLVAPVVYNTGQGPQGVAVGDLRGNGRLDIVTANQTSASVSVLLGNGDGIPDLVTVNVKNTKYIHIFTYSLLAGNGDGTFKTAVTHTLPHAPSSL